MKSTYFHTLILTLLAVLNSTILLAQQHNYIAGELIVKTISSATIETIINNFAWLDGQASRLHVKKTLAPSLHIFLLSFDHQTINQQKMAAALRNHPKLLIVQNNHRLEQRETTPNDPQFNNQWQYINEGNNGGTIDADLDADQAWDITTGGNTALGDEIVVAIIDDGIDTDHDDFGDNLWINTAEIPNNSIDDDNNGFIDDYLGWNAYDNDDNIGGNEFLGGSHGTPIAGIIGAKGNNNIGVTGINWQVKLMIIVGGGNEADAIAAYSYPLQMRTLYNESSGTKGAFVVSTNSSWGINNGQPDESPIWCAMYDEMGIQGILSCGATTNSNQDVDLVGDLPTACPSDYLISVTNMNNTGNKVTNAGYGLNTIDLGAFGENTWTTDFGNSYAPFGGTSGATPHVTGAIALLYAAPCTQLALIARTNPAEAALLVKSFILDGTEPNESLAGISATGGSLNLFNSLNLAMSYNCSTDCIPPFGINITILDDVSAAISWTNTDNSDNYLVSYQAANNPIADIQNSTENNITLTNLSPCTEYAVELFSECDSLTSTSSGSYTFVSDGCCIAPNDIVVSLINDENATITWSNVLAANTYTLQYRKVGTDPWLILENIESPFILNELINCTDYEIQVGISCDNSNSDFSASTLFLTNGCGSCIDNTYCNTFGETNTYEWIGHISLGDIDNNSDNAENGYSNFTTISTDLAQEQDYALSLSPEFSGTPYSEYFKVWIDYNQDGILDDQSEVVFESDNASSATITGIISIPNTALTGSTRMRISMKWFSDNTPQGPCETVTYGEVEDYCVTITPSTGIINMASNSFSLAPNPFIDQVTITPLSLNNQALTISLYTIVGQQKYRQTFFINDSNPFNISLHHLPPGLYLISLNLGDGRYYEEKIIKLYN